MRLSKMPSKLFLGVAVWGLLLSAAYARSDAQITTTHTASAGTVLAEISYQSETLPDPLGAQPIYHPRLKLLRNGRTVFDEAVPNRGKDVALCLFNGPEVRDLDGDGEPEILISYREDWEQPRSTLIYRYNPASESYILEQRPNDEKLEISRKLKTRRVATSKNVRAELAFDEDIFVEGEVHLKLNRTGELILHGVIALDDEEALIAGVYGPVIVDLDGDGELEVFFNVLSHGAYCCSYTIIYHYINTKKKYARLQQFWVNYRNLAVPKDIDNDGVPEFVSRNEQFSGEFGPYAMTGASPIQIWRYRRGRLQDVTRRYPNLIRQDAQNWWDAYTQKKSDWYMNPIPLTAYLADMYMLGQGHKGWKQVRKVYRAEDRQQFFRQLRRELTKHGYAK